MINNIRISPNELYGPGRSTENAANEYSGKDFSEIMNNISYNSGNNSKENNINISSFGPPAGFFADMSMLDEEDIKELGVF